MPYICKRGELSLSSSRIFREIVMANELQSLSSLFQERLFRIPDYQRGYAWQQDQLIDFWDDLNNLQIDLNNLKESKYHYTGLLSLKLLNQEETNRTLGKDIWMENKGYKTYHIVDGQQRLTTFIILLNEIISFISGLKENKKKTEEQITLGDATIKEIRAKYIYQKRPNDIITTYLFGYEADTPSDKYLRHKVFNEPNSGEIKETYYTKNLKNAKSFFCKNISALFDEEGIDGLNKMYQKLTKKLMFNLHEIDDDYDVCVAFETMNNRGKRLTNLELLKNRLIYLTTIYGESVDGLDRSELRQQINDAWKEIYSQLGKNKTKALSDDDFLRAHWIIYYAYTRKRGDDYINFLLDKFSAKNVFEKKPIIDATEQPCIVEENLNNNENEDDEISVETLEESSEVIQKLAPCEISDYVNSLKNLARYWYDTWFPNESTKLSLQEKLWIDRLNRINIASFRPLVTVTLCKCTVEEERIALFKAIERFIFICFRLANYRADYKSVVYNNAARDIYKGKLSVNEVTNDLNSLTDENIRDAIPRFITDMKKKFSSGNKAGYYAWYSLQYFMYEYEYSLCQSTGVKKISWELFTKSEKDDKVSIEHILPQTPSKSYWQNHFRQFIHNEQEMNALTGSLGNLLPLAQSINKSLQNDSFDDKKTGTTKRERGYLNGSNSEIEVAREDAWDGQRIYQRSMRLLSFMEKRWNISITDAQKEELSFVSFVNDGRNIPDEIPEVEEITPTQSKRKRQNKMNNLSN